MSDSNSGLSIGAIVGMGLAAWISWTNVPSVFWAIFHGVFGWLYVIYAFIVGKVHF
jgi:hypothetical protein